MKKQVINIFFLFFLLLNFLFSYTKAQSSFYFDLNTRIDYPFSHIYHITKSNSEFIYLCTESGVYEFDGLENRAIPWENTIKDEILYFQKDETGNVYGTGLKNRIYKIESDSIRLVIDWNDSTEQYTNFLVHENILYLPSKSSIITTFNLINKKFDYIQLGLKLSKGQYIEPLLFWDDKIHLRILDGEIQRLITYNLSSKLVEVIYEGNLIYKGHYIKTPQSLHYVALGQDEKLLKFDKKINQFIEIEEIFKDKIGRYRSESKQNGILFFGEYGLEIYNEHYHLESYLFKEEKITGVVANKNSLWVSTLENGLYFIPNLQSKVFTSDGSLLESNNLTGLVEVENTVFFLEDKEKIWCFDSEAKIQKCIEKPSEEISVMKYSIASNSLLIGTFNYAYEFQIVPQIRLLDSFPNLGNKDLDKMSNFLIYGNTYGCFTGFLNGDELSLEAYFNKNISDSLSFESVSNLSYTRISNDRCVKTLINPFDSSVWVIDGRGVWKYKKNTKTQIKFEDKAILANDLQITKQGELWISTANAIYFYSGSVLIEYVVLSEDFPTIYINSISYHEPLIIASTNIGVFTFDRTTKKYMRWTKNNGLPSDNISKAIVSNGKMYAISNKGLTVLAMENNAEFINNEVFIKEVKIDDKVVDPTEKNHFDYNQNRLTIQLSALDLRSFENRLYYYRLLGANQEWIRLDKNTIIRFPNLSPGNYTFEVYVEGFNGNRSKIKSFSFEIKSPVWQSWLFFLFVSLILFALLFFIFSKRLKRIKKEKELQTKLIQSEIDGLKAQMNPHFIFNALNSIQNLIIQKQVNESNLYLGKFAELLRSVLNYSSKDRISIQEEVDLLKIYLDLEKLRFNDKVTTEIIIEDEEELLNFSIPPMMLQPYVENAIKHGLLHSQNEEKKLIIRFLKEEKSVLCQIIDNGIGMEASNKINQRRKKNHQSFSTAAIEKRINLINASLIYPILIHIEDLDKGTKVEIRFPLIMRSRTRIK